MTDKVRNILNTQIQEELYSAYLYLALAGYLESTNLKGMANWMYVQVKEEVDHAMGLHRFLLERGATPELEVIGKPDISLIKNPADVFAAALKHEQHITDLINKILEVAREEKDYALESFIKWYIDEQVEEEESAFEALEKVNLAAGNGPALLILDEQFASRIYTPGGPYASKA